MGGVIYMPFVHAYFLFKGRWKPLWMLSIPLFLGHITITCDIMYVLFNFFIDPQKTTSFKGQDSDALICMQNQTSYTKI